ncbi:unnamed protein product [Blepharisma stoltei]|uniref:Uncharacterized protein n=1 Tax=Blepharisma stoltei TaxID=1481888 RepID=A0AAU9IDA0_9CILI|nr:unnamed protein product [Blepharisma stoltei]
MSEANKKIKRNSLIYPLFPIASPSPQKLISPKSLKKLIKPLHKRAQSDIVNPYLDHRDLINLKASTKLSRQNIQETKNSPQIPKKSKLSSIIQPKIISKPNLIIKKSEKMPNPDIMLTELQGEPVFKAPKRFSNQFFTDVYDIDGNHDRIEVEDSMELFSELESNKIMLDPCTTFYISDLEKEASPTKKSIKVQDSSYIEKSREIPDDSVKKLSVGQEFFCKLNKMLNEQDQDYQSEETTSISGGKSRV